MKRILLGSCLLLSLCFGGGSVGCAKNAGPQDTPAQLADADRMTGIQERTGGDWSKLTAADKKWLIDQCGGNENSAKMLLSPPKVHVGPPGGPRK